MFFRPCSIDSLEDEFFTGLFINREAGEIIRLVASVRPSVRPSMLIESTSQGAFKMVVVLTGCTIAVDHTFN